MVPAWPDVKSQLEPIRLLVVDVSIEEADLTLRHVQDAGLRFESKVVTNRTDFERALTAGSWSAVVADDHLSGLAGSLTLDLVAALAGDVPVILVSAQRDEPRVGAAMKAGATDYFFKSDLVRLAPAIEREVRDASFRNAWRTTAEELRANR